MHLTQACRMLDRFKVVLRPFSSNSTCAKKSIACASLYRHRNIVIALSHHFHLIIALLCHRNVDSNLNAALYCSYLDSIYKQIFLFYHKRSSTCTWDTVLGHKQVRTPSLILLSWTSGLMIIKLLNYIYLQDI